MKVLDYLWDFFLYSLVVDINEARYSGEQGTRNLRNLDIFLDGIFEHQQNVNVAEHINDFV